MVPRWLRIVLWTIAFLAFAAAGAFLASRTDPFPPGVSDPGGREGVASPAETPEPTETGSEEGEPMALVLQARTAATYSAGESCEARWRLDAPVAVTPGRRSEISGRAVRVGPVRCDLPNAQRQARAVRMRIVLRPDGDATRVSLEAGQLVPAGSQELTGFLDHFADATFDVPRGTGSVDFDEGAAGSTGTESRARGRIVLIATTPV